MIKKSAFILLIFMITISTMVLGYEINDIKIDIPQNFQASNVENFFADEEGNSIGISISEIGSLQYTEENLDKIVNTLTNDLDSRREEIKNKMNNQYGNVLSKEYIENYANNVKIDVLKKEITTFGVDSYKCFHYIASIDMIESKYFAEFYQTQSNGKVYTITISSNNSDFFENDDIKNAINSCKIENYQEPQEKDINNEANQKYRKTENYLMIACVVIAALGLVGLKNKNINNKEEKNK